jgi:hypothetical protein
MAKSFNTFEDFWPYYLRQHATRQTRFLHFIGTTTALLCLVALVYFRDYRWLIGVLIAPYAFAWLGHAFFEGNSPAAFAFPLWSLRADVRMLRLWLVGDLEPELKKAGVVADPEAAE